MKRIIAILFLLGGFILVESNGAHALLIDQFDKSTNLIGGRTGTYVKEPSRILATTTDREAFGAGGKALMVKYDKKGSGGPYGNGGWCGYYTQLKKGSKYFNAGEYKNIVLYVKGEKGGENFKLGLADRHWDQVGDSIKSEDIINYIPSGEITTEWQKAVVPLDIFYLDHKELGSLAIAFETDCYPDGSGKGTIYVDAIGLE